MASPTYRFASPDDAEVLHGFNVHHAEFEDEEDLLETRPKNIRAALDRTHPYFVGLIASCQEEDMGMAICWPVYNSWSGKRSVWLDDLYILESGRGRGLGRGLIREVANLTISRRCDRLEWIVARENTKAIGFYQKIGARPLADRYLWKFEAAPLTRIVENERESLKDISFRMATPEDSDAILRMHIVNARERGKSQVVEISSDLIEDQLSMAKPPFECILACDQNDEEVVGMATFFQYYSSWRGPGMWLEDLYVKQGYRRRGIGKQLVVRVGKITVERKLERPGLQFTLNAVKSSFTPFFNSIGADRLDKWIIYRMNKKSLEAAAEYKK